MRQLTLAMASFERYGKTTRRAAFLGNPTATAAFRGCECYGRLSPSRR